MLRIFHVASAGPNYSYLRRTGVDVDLPIIEPLQRALDGMPRHDAETLLVSSKGMPWTYRGMSNAWCKWRHEQYEAGFLADDLTHKGLWHTVATILRAQGATLRNIARNMEANT